MQESAITSKGQTTLPRQVRAALGLNPGDRVRYLILDDGEVRLLRTRPAAELAGALQHRGPPVSLDDMEKAIAGGAGESDG